MNRKYWENYYTQSEKATTYNVEEKREKTEGDCKKLLENIIELDTKEKGNAVTKVLLPDNQ